MAPAQSGLLPAVHDSGAGFPVLFLHGFPLDASQWDHQVAALSGDFRCLRVDAWGCGSSPEPPDGDPSLDAFAGATAAALDTLGVDGFAVVGHSMGGYTAFALWRAVQPRIRALALCNTRPTADLDSARADRLSMADRALRDHSVEFIVEPSVRRLLGPDARDEAHIADPVRGRIRRCSPAGVAYSQRAMARRPDSSPLLASIAVPTLVIAGTHDELITVHEVRAMADGITDAEYAELDSGHLGNLEQPAEFSALLDGFLGRALGGR